MALILKQHFMFQIIYLKAVAIICDTATVRSADALLAGTAAYDCQLLAAAGC